MSSSEFIPDNVDPELQQAIAEAQKKPWMQAGIKPTKYNLGETRSPLEVLQAEAGGENTSQANPGNYQAQGMSLVKGNAPLEFIPDTKQEEFIPDQSKDDFTRQALHKVINPEFDAGPVGSLVRMGAKFTLGAAAGASQVANLWATNPNASIEDVMAVHKRGMDAAENLPLLNRGIGPSEQETTEKISSMMEYLQQRPANAIAQYSGDNIALKGLKRIYEQNPVLGDTLFGALPDAVMWAGLLTAPKPIAGKISEVKARALAEAAGRKSDVGLDEIAKQIDERFKPKEEVKASEPIQSETPLPDVQWPVGEAGQLDPHTGPLMEPEGAKALPRLQKKDFQKQYDARLQAEVDAAIEHMKKQEASRDLEHDVQASAGGDRTIQIRKLEDQYRQISQETSATKYDQLKELSKQLRELQGEPDIRAGVSTIPGDVIKKRIEAEAVGVRKDRAAKRLPPFTEEEIAAAKQTPPEDTLLHTLGDKEMRKDTDKYLRAGTLVDYTANRGTGYETQHTGKIVEVPEHPGKVFVRDGLTGELVAMEHNHLDRIYDNRGQFVSDILHSIPNMGPLEFIERLQNTLTKEEQAVDATGDIKPQIGLANAHFRSLNPSWYTIGKPNFFANLVSAFYDNHIRTYVGKEHSFNYEDTVKSIRPFMQAYTTGHVFAIGPWKPKYEAFQKHMGILLDMEKNSKDWFDGTHYYQTAEQLAQRGMDAKYIPVWQSIFSMLERKWDMEKLSAEAAGRRVPDRIPGYMPHEFKGPWRVNAYTLGKDGVKLHVGSVGFFNEAARDKAYAALKQKGFEREGVELEKITPRPDGKDMSGLMSGTRELMEAMGQSPLMKKVFERIHESASHGIITSALDRGNPTQWGHQLERTQYGKESVLGLTQTGMRDAMDIFRRYSEGVNGWYVRTQFVKEVLIPLEASGKLNAYPKLWEKIERSTKSFLKIPDVMEAVVNSWIAAEFIQHGMDPHLGKEISAKMTTGAALTYLLWNVGFYATNVFQRVMSIPQLLAMQGQQHWLGAKTGSIIKALKDRSAVYNDHYSLDPDKPHFWQKAPMSEELRYAVEHGHIDPGFNELITPGKIHDPIAIEIERRTRADAFMTMYHYAKQIMGKEEALRAAGKHADAVGVPYHSQFGPQSWIQSLQIFERPLLMFTNFMSHTGSMMKNMGFTGAKAMKENPLAAAKILGALAGWQLSVLALFGVNGPNLVENATDIIKLTNRAFGWETTTPIEWARGMDRFMPEHLRGVPAFGLVSVLNPGRLNVSASGTGMNIQVPTAFINFAEGPINASLLLAKWALYGAGLSDKKPTAMDQWDLMRNSPSKIASMAEYGIKYGWDVGAMTKDALTGQLYKNSVSNIPWDTNPTKDIMNDPGNYRRSQAEAITRLLTGATTIDEKAATQSTIISDTLVKNREDVLKHMEQAFIESRGKLDIRTLKFMQKMSEQYGPDLFKNLGPTLVKALEKAASDADAYRKKQSTTTRTVRETVDYLIERQNEPRRGY